MTTIQLDLFKSDEESEIEHLRSQLECAVKSLGKVRRGTYARLNELQKKQNEIIGEFECWKKTVCQNVKS